MVAPGNRGEDEGEAMDPSALSVVDEAWELLDPTPDLRALFLQLDERFFEGRLGAVAVRWSRYMKESAGNCRFETLAAGGWRCAIRLSEPLLKWRSRRDLVETLLHEMIHAYLCVTGAHDREEHGPRFHRQMRRVNRLSGANVTVHHEFFAEMDLYRPHWWRCDGPCRRQEPDFGYVKRPDDTAPSKWDPWWAEHRRTCGGSFVKVRSPDSPKDTDEDAAKAGRGGSPSPTSGNKDYKKTKKPAAPCREETDLHGEGDAGSSIHWIACGEEDDLYIEGDPRSKIQWIPCADDDDLYIAGDNRSKIRWIPYGDNEDLFVAVDTGSNQHWVPRHDEDLHIGRGTEDETVGSICKKCNAQKRPRCAKTVTASQNRSGHAEEVPSKRQKIR